MSEAKFVLNKVAKLRDSQQYNWEKLHQAINPNRNKIIGRKITKLTNEYNIPIHVIVNYFIKFTNENKNDNILQILDRVENKDKIYVDKISAKHGHDYKINKIR